MVGKGTLIAGLLRVEYSSWESPLNILDVLITQSDSSLTIIWAKRDSYLVAQVYLVGGVGHGERQERRVNRWVKR